MTEPPKRRRGPNKNKKPLTVSVEVEYVTGEAGRHLAEVQAEVIRELLEWAKDQKPDTP